MQKFLDDIVGLPALWAEIKKLVNNSKFSEARFSVNTNTGHLNAQMDGNISLNIDANGHLLSEVK